MTICFFLVGIRLTYIGINVLKPYVSIPLLTSCYRNSQAKLCRSSIETLQIGLHVKFIIDIIVIDTCLIELLLIYLETQRRNEFLFWMAFNLCCFPWVFPDLFPLTGVMLKQIFGVVIFQSIFQTPVWYCGCFLKQMTSDTIFEQHMYDLVSWQRPTSCFSKFHLNPILA